MKHEREIPRYLILYIPMIADQEQLDYDVKKLQSFVKEKTLSLSDKGALSDRISPQLLRAMVTLKDSKG